MRLNFKAFWSLKAVANVSQLMKTWNKWCQDSALNVSRLGLLRQVKKLGQDPTSQVNGKEIIKEEIQQENINVKTIYVNLFFTVWNKMYINARVQARCKWDMSSASWSTPQQT